MYRKNSAGDRYSGPLWSQLGRRFDLFGSLVSFIRLLALVSEDTTNFLNHDSLFALRLDNAKFFLDGVHSVGILMDFSYYIIKYIMHY